MEVTIINILKFTDQFGTLLTMGQTVSVDEPNDSNIDGYNNGFIGTVAGFRGPCVVVNDQEGDAFEVEPHKLTIEQ